MHIKIAVNEVQARGSVIDRNGAWGNTQERINLVGEGKQIRRFRRPTQTWALLAHPLGVQARFVLLLVQILLSCANFGCGRRPRRPNVNLSGLPEFLNDGQTSPLRETELVFGQNACQPSPFVLYYDLQDK